MITKIDKDTLKVNDVDKLVETIDKLRPTAREMFKMLGYNKMISIFMLKNRKIQVRRQSRTGYHNNKKDITIYFKDKQIIIKNVYNAIITLDELTAINKQIEELGW